MVVYKITNRLNGKIYVGQTRKPIEQRFSQHAKADTPLGNAMRKYGLENFTIEVIDTCETREQIVDRERFWIRVLNCKVPNGYNQSDGGEGKFTVVDNKKSRDMKFSEEPKISESLKRFRQEQKLSQRQLSEKIGVPYQSYQTYEYGSSVPSVNVIKKIVEAFDVSADYLLGYSDEPRPQKYDAEEVADAFALRDALRKVLVNVR